jgi:hypothetical protein
MVDVAFVPAIGSPIRRSSSRRLHCSSWTSVQNPDVLLLLLLHIPSMAMASNGHEGFTHEEEGQRKKTINLVSDLHGIIL